MGLRYFPVVCSLLPICAVHICYWLAVQAGHLESCIPYLEGCTSISKTGRSPPEAIVFKGLMIPAFLLIGVYWMLMRHWLLFQGEVFRRSANILMWLGIFSAGFLVLYGASLGYYAEEYRMSRRLGVMVGFTAMLIAQLYETGLLRQLASVDAAEIPEWVVRTKLALVGAILAIGILSVILDYTMDNYRQAPEDIIEWNFALLLFSFYLPTAWLWKGFSLSITRT